MKTRTWVAGTLALAAMLVTAWAGSRTLSVQVKEGPVRAAPSFVGQIVGNLSYGDRVEVVDERAGWLKVATSTGVCGWMHQSALTEKRIVMRAGSGAVQTGASGEELALAGKGFNSDVEAQFKAQNRAIDFGPVDRMERRKASQAEMAAFLKEGRVHPAEGGAR